ncbi:TspO/MBR family protein [Streptomyces sp900116325]|uniref:TspO/MBR family protein n=1 Tax=Streptomyces sp. 900116325 TaxID=3154295 RepID=UPI003332517B
MAVAAAATVGAAAVDANSAWYRELAAPRWQPPPWVFGAVWTPLHASIAWSAGRAWSPPCFLAQLYAGASDVHSRCPMTALY